MNLNKQQAIKLSGMSENSWRKSSTKERERYLNKAGYRLVGTYKIGREVFFQVEKKGDELLRMVELFKEYGLPTNNMNKFVKFIALLDDNSTIQLSDIAKELGVSTKTIYNWRKKLEEKNIIKYNPRALPARYKNGKRELCTKEQWAEYVKELNRLKAAGVPMHDIARVIYSQTGYFYRKTGEATSNGFFEEFFSLLEKALNQLED